MNSLDALKSKLPENWQKYLNFYIFLNFAAYAVWHLKKAHSSGALHITDVTFALQSLLLCSVILVRRDHKAVEPSLWRQTVALAAFFSGLLMLGSAPASSPLVLQASLYITLTANCLGLLTILNLGRSFGILIAVREVKTDWLYSLVRHPMYATDILLRVGYLVGHPTPFAAAVVLFTVLAYYWRARYEEEFLSRDPVYREYMAKVPFRFIPYVL